MRLPRVWRAELARTGFVFRLLRLKSEKCLVDLLKVASLDKVQIRNEVKSVKTNEKRSF